MKLIKIIMLFSSLAINSLAFAHGDGHGKVDGKKALKIAQKAAKKLTFKDFGTSIGKLDESWLKIAPDTYQVIEMNEKRIVVKAINNTIEQTAYFKIAVKGKVIDVSENYVAQENTGHNHAH